jgi:hypothetical protein
VVVPSLDYGELLVAINKSCDDMNKQKPESFTTKVIQLYDTFFVRFGVMLVGPTGGGKTVCYETLQRSMTWLREQESKNATFQVLPSPSLPCMLMSFVFLFFPVDTSQLLWIARLLLMML